MANRIELYKKTVDILFNAYFNGTLEHGNGCGCAVGNLVAAGMGYKMVIDCGSAAWENKRGEFSFPEWNNVHNMGERLNISKFYGEAAKQIKATGYYPSETLLIERFFEFAHRGNSEEDYMFNGLVAVLEALKQIHEITDEDLLTSSRKRFETVYATK